MVTMRSGSGTGSGRRSTDRTTVKMVALPPRQIPSVRIVVSANPRSRHSVRKANLTSWISRSIVCWPYALRRTPCTRHDGRPAAFLSEPALGEAWRHRARSTTHRARRTTCISRPRPASSLPSETEGDREKFLEGDPALPGAHQEPVASGRNQHLAVRHGGQRAVQPRHADVRERGPQVNA